MRQELSVIRERRRVLRQSFRMDRDFELLEESCVPSYCHPNPAAAAMAWWRLLAASRLFRKLASGSPILDFGAASGEVFHLLRTSGDYDFVEQNDALAALLMRQIPTARRTTIEELPRAHYAAIFALDSLEHNEEIAPIVDRLAAALQPKGLLIVSGPTENALYRLGRRLAGFSGHYHHTTIYDIERCLAARLRQRAVRKIPPLAPLFRLSAWSPGPRPA